MSSPRRRPPPAGATTLLAVEKVDTFYGKSHILNGVSLDVSEHEIVALLGRNGAGKSTLLKTLIGIAPPETGSIKLAGDEIARLPSAPIARRGIGYVPQGRGLFAGMTVADNLALGRLKRQTGAGVHWDDERIVWVFPRLAQRWYTPADYLSGGEQQMVAVARALAGDVRLLLLDEPFEGLSPAITEELFEAFNRLRYEIAMVIVDHHLDLALALSDRTVILERGAVTWTGHRSCCATTLSCAARNCGCEGESHAACCHHRIGPDRPRLGHGVCARRLGRRAVRRGRRRRRQGARPGGRRARRACQARAGGRSEGRGGARARGEKRRGRARRRELRAGERAGDRRRQARDLRRARCAGGARRDPCLVDLGDRARACSPRTSQGRARCLVAHPVNPPHLVPIVELVGAPWTAPETIARAKQVYESVKQVPIVVRREIEGFILNRLQGALLAEAFRLVGEGYVSPQDLDKTIKDGLGLRWSFMGRSPPSS